MMPVHIVRHPHRECDDTIAHLAWSVHSDEDCVVVSSDTDFIQLLTPGSERIKLWNPIKKSWVAPVQYDYVKWKSLTGDGSDGIPGFKGVGGKTAEKLLNNPQKLEAFLSEGDNQQIFDRNHFLISFMPIEDELEAIHPSTQWESVRSSFIQRGFWSIANDKSWNKFTNTFSGVQ
jgi:5'-3' exonuclease